MLRQILPAIAIAPLLSIFAYPKAVSEQQVAETSCSGNGVSIESELQKHGVSMTPSALREALRGDDAEVRRLAASALEEIKDPEAVTLIRSAMETEEVSRIRLNMANNLLDLGDRSGVPVLESMCESNEDEGALRLSSAEVLRQYHIESEKCFTEIEDLVRSTQSPELRAVGIFDLGKYRNLPTEDLRRVRQLQLVLLHDPDTSVRIRAVESLAMSGDVSVLPVLKHLEVKETAHKEMDDWERREIALAIVRLSDSHTSN